MAMHGHVELLAGHTSSGKASLEEVPAEEIGPNVYRVLGTPALVVGCAEGDTIEVAAGGEFTVLARGRNVAIQIFGRLDDDLVHSLRDVFQPLAGKVEAADDVRFVVVTVPVIAGFTAIEDAINHALTGRDDVEWYFGNVYDDDDQPLNWWTDP